MELWIIRHGEASQEVNDEAGPPLSESGMQKLHQVSAALKKLPRQPNYLFCSPLRRAEQTAALFNEQWKLTPQTVPWLNPGVEPSKILSELNVFSEGNIAIVGHLPSVGWLFSTMVWGLPPKEVVLPKGSVTCLQVQAWNPAGAKLQWVYHPELGMTENHES